MVGGGAVQKNWDWYGDQTGSGDLASSATFAACCDLEQLTSTDLEQMKW